MSPVKIIHLLKRLEVLDRDIEELRQLEDTLSKTRSYSHAMKISVELISENFQYSCQLHVK